MIFPIRDEHMAIDRIEVKGARAHNLKNIDVTIPRDQLVVRKPFDRIDVRLIHLP
jgi:hypothetical protein